VSDLGPALDELADLLGAVSHPDRLKLLLALRDGPMDVASLKSAVGISQSRTSQHLGLLKAHRLLTSERDGRRVRYAIADRRVVEWVFTGVGFLHTPEPLEASVRALEELVRD